MPEGPRTDESEEFGTGVTEPEQGEADDAPGYRQRAPSVVGLGGSGDSIAALQRFFEGMPPDSGMTFIVALALPTDGIGTLGDALQRSTAMPIEMAADGQGLEPDRVYVVPPDTQLTITVRHVQLSPLVCEPGRPSAVDLFFRSLADSHGAQAVAIVLSSADGDGALGVKRIKERGGLTIVQEPEVAGPPDPPKPGLDTSVVDWVLRAEDIPARLLEYRAREERLHVPPERGPNPAAPPRPAVRDEEATLREVLAVLRARTGHDFSYYKRATIVRRIARRMQVSEVDDLASYLAFLRTHPGEAGALLQDLLISVTNFFRDREAFEALAEHIPRLFHDKTQTDTVRVWVPACATGEEAYSIAMLLSEHARTLEAPPALQVFATDLDEHVLLEARNGVYPEAIAADVSAERLRRFFVREHTVYRVRRELREILLFAVHDLLKDSPFSRLDLVSCRNLLIYLNRSAQERAMDVFHFALRPEGHLFLGTSESVEDGSQLFATVDKKHRLYASRAVARPNLPVPWGQSTLARVLALQEQGDNHGAAARSPTWNHTSLALRPTPVSERMSWSELHLKLIERLGGASLIVNGEYDILHLSSAASPFLQFAGGEPSMNLLRVIHPSLRVELRAALFRARQSGEPSAADGVAFELDGQLSRVTLKVASAAELARDCYLVSFEAHADEGPTSRPAPQHDEPLIRHLERELEQTKRYLRDLVQQHEASTEELKASNEELQAMNEELRSATEELESSREELQSINEELTTVNQELKSKVDELGHANSDLHNLMGATEIATIFLDRELHIMRFTPPAVALFSLIASDVGRPLGHFQHRLSYADLLSDAARVLQQLVPIEREVAELGGRYFLARLLPYRTTEDRIAGVVLTFVDVTERQQAQEAAKAAKADLERRVQERTAELDAVNATLRKEALEHQKAEKARQELQRKLLDAQEEERGRISRELHDEVGQQLSALMLSLKALENAPSEQETRLKLRELRATAEKAGREIHKLALELRPLALDQLGLLRALASLLESWQTRTGISVDFVSAGLGDARFPAPIESTLYRIVQEAMSNVYKHAAAKNVSVSVERRAGFATAFVEDDGVGFDPSRLDQSDGERIGIVGMRERAEIVGGSLSIESSPGRGTTVRVRVPLPEAPTP